MNTETHPPLHELCAAAERCARLAGTVLLDWRDRFTTSSKGPKDLVTEADIAAQRAIREEVARLYPGHRFLGEEDASLQDAFPLGKTASEQHSAYRWIVDPLDGTTNYVRGLPAFATSIAVERHGELVVGVVYDPLRDECFTARAGEGAFLNGIRLTTSGCETLGEAMVAASFAPDVQRDAPEIAEFLEVLQRCHSLRRIGSAALNLSYLAAGRIDAYWSRTTKIWDIAAGALLIREAAGLVTSLGGEPLQVQEGGFVAAATPKLHAEFLAILALSVPPGENLPSRARDR